MALTYLYVAAQHITDEPDGTPVCSDVVKVGVARDPSGRLMSLQTGCPYPLLAVHLEAFPTRRQAHKVEAIAHALLRPQRTSGEWFNCGIDRACEAVAEAVSA